MKLLLIEDDSAMRTTLERSFKRLGWLVQTCADGEAALALWQQLTLDVVLLDLSLPGLDGLQVLERARKMGLNTPVLILTARGTVGDRILGLNTGADDYLPKPFDLDELEARIRALVRARARSDASEGLQEKSAVRRQEIGAVSYEKESGVFYFERQALELSPRESKMLLCFFERSGQAVAKEQLLERVFASDPEIQGDAIEVVAYRLRKKLASTGLKLITLRGLGYLLKEDAE
ncbi:response regulator [Variovorax sp. PCZ-1]|uniref:response regulator n=1 Tax=Variovorax sp. PCZ-1 TaxID=2835533 RepID=UPI001BD02E03|nr:response regulator [Variovorax sp. PCZ-1]MBS7806637.1 response regulator [Variovorax sp. PCZ-1]